MFTSFERSIFQVNLEKNVLVFIFKNDQENERVRKRACFGNVLLLKVVHKGKQKSCTRRNFNLQEDSQQHHQCRRKKGPEKIFQQETEQEPWKATKKEHSD